jgi:ATP-dependent Clp protease ATP-binding subunit ClpA
MFDRFSDSARRVLFLARYEAGEFGSPSIEPEHLVLGLLHSPHRLVARVFKDAHLSADDIRRNMDTLEPRREKLEAFVDLPLSAQAKRALQFSVEEAALLQEDVRPEHILLGVLRTQPTVAGTPWANYGIQLDAVRSAIAERAVTPKGHGTETGTERAPRLVVVRLEIKEEDMAELAAQFDSIKRLVGQLDSVGSDGSYTKSVVDQMQEQLDALKKRLGL